MTEPDIPFIEIHSGIRLKGQLSMTKDVVITARYDGELQTLGCLTVVAGGVATGKIEAGSLVLEPGNQLEALVKISSPTSAPAPKGFDMVNKIRTGKWPLGLKKVKDLVLGRK